jgi:hypothetical protein
MHQWQLASPCSRTLVFHCLALTLSLQFLITSLMCRVRRSLHRKPSFYQGDGQEDGGTDEDDCVELWDDRVLFGKPVLPLSGAAEAPQVEPTASNTDVSLPTQDEPVLTSFDEVDEVAPNGLLLTDPDTVHDDAVGPTAQDHSTQIAKLDALYQHALDTGFHKITNQIEAVRRNEEKKLSGIAAQDHRVALELAAERRAEESHRSAVRAGEAHNDQVAAQIKDQRNRLAAERELTKNRKRKAAEMQELLCETQARDQAELRLDATMFQAKVQGVAKARAYRWEAFKRILSLRPSPPADRMLNLEREFQQWDHYEATFHCDSHAAQFDLRMRRLMKWRHEDTHKLVHDWWEKERAAKVTDAPLVIPGLHRCAV